MGIAARKSDPTSHGGLISSGDGTVLIGDLPAARVGDTHVCPMADGARPHVGGQIVGGEKSVLIGDRMAARVGDACACTAGPSSVFQISVRGPSASLTHVDTDADGVGDTWVAKASLGGIDVVYSDADGEHLTASADILKLEGTAGDTDHDGAIDTLQGSASLGAGDYDAQGTVGDVSVASRGDAQVVEGEASASSRTDSNGEWTGSGELRYNGQESRTQSSISADGYSGGVETEERAETIGIGGSAEVSGDGPAARVQVDTAQAQDRTTYSATGPGGTGASATSQNTYLGGDAAIGGGLDRGEASADLFLYQSRYEANVDLPISGGKAVRLEGQLERTLGVGEGGKLLADQNPMDGDFGGYADVPLKPGLGVGGGIGAELRDIPPPAAPAAAPAANIIVAPGCPTVIIGD